MKICTVLSVLCVVIYMGEVALVMDGCASVGTPDYNRDDGPSCRDCSKQGEFNCTVGSYSDMLKYNIDRISNDDGGGYQSTIIGVDWFNATLSITLTVPPNERAVILDFRSVRGTNYTDDYYAYHTVTRVFDVRNNTLNVLKLEKVITYPCLYGLDTCKNPEKDDVRVYKITLTTVPSKVSKTHLISTYNAERSTGWKATISIATLNSRNGIEVTFSPNHVDDFTMYCLILQMNEGSDWKTYKNDGLVFIDFRDSRTRTFHDLTAGDYKVTVKMYENNIPLPSRSESAVFTYRYGQISIVQEVLHTAVESTPPPPPPPATDDPAVYVVTGIILGIALLILLAGVTWWKRKEKLVPDIQDEHRSGGNDNKELGKTERQEKQNGQDEDLGVHYMAMTEVPSLNENTSDNAVIADVHTNGHLPHSQTDQRPECMIRPCNGEVRHKNRQPLNIPIDHANYIGHNDIATKGQPLPRAESNDTIENAFIEINFGEQQYVPHCCIHRQ